MELPKVTLRPYDKPTDHPIVKSWVDHAETQRWVRFNLDAFHVKPESLTVGVLADGTPCSLIHRTEHSIHALIVAPELRGRGIGRATIQALIDATPEIVELWATIGTDNAASAKAFRASGFVVNPGHSDRHTVHHLRNRRTPNIALVPFAEAHRAAVQGWIDRAPRGDLGTFSLDFWEDRGFDYSTVVLDDGTPCGFLAHATAKVGILIVDPEQGNRGIGKQILREYLALPTTADEVETLVRDTNRVSIRAFEAVGFSQDRLDDGQPPAVWLSIRLAR